MGAVQGKQLGLLAALLRGIPFPHAFYQPSCLELGKYLGYGGYAQMGLLGQLSRRHDLPAPQKRQNQPLVMILDIFAKRASTSEGKLQVELAQLRYRASHLVGGRSELSRLGGGIGTRGPGEQKLEMDRRLIKERITLVKRELEQVKRTES